MPSPPSALDYLAKTEKFPAAGVCVLYGDEAFLKREALSALRREVLGGEDGELSLTVLDGRTASARDLFDELATLALFGDGRRLVVVDAADDFVTANRAALEDYVAKPRAHAVLVLDLKSFPANTRLFKAVAASGLPIDCATPPAARLQKWLTAWALDRHGMKLEAGAAETMLDLVGPLLGVLDQELAKLAAYAGPGGVVTRTNVVDLVGGWRAKTTWEMLDAALAGDARKALAELDRLLAGGENPVGLLAQMGASLRRFAAAARLLAAARSRRDSLSLRDALVEAGIRPFAVAKAEAQLRQLGRERAERLYRLLVETDLALKGASTLPPRTVLERLIAQLSEAAAPPPAPSRTTVAAR